ncbi:MAG: DUF2147 domain-containing protein [Terracidiphilus sp.]
MSFPRTRVMLIKVLLLAFAAPFGLSLSALAQAVDSPAHAQASPVGRWKTVDDATGKVKSIVQIREENGELYGTIEALFDPPVPHPTCYLCTGDLKDRPLVGLQVLSGFAQVGAQWSGGQVLDPESGKIYRASLTLEDGGKKLRLHGYFLVPILGRTEHWQRDE